MKCVICRADDGLTLMCGRHWAEYVKWYREHEGTYPLPAEGDDE